MAGVAKCFPIKIASTKSKHRTIKMGTLEHQGPLARTKALKPHRATGAWMVWSNIHFFTCWSRWSTREKKKSNKLGYCGEAAASTPSLDACRTSMVEHPGLSSACSKATLLMGPHWSCCQPRPGAPCPSDPQVLSLPAPTGTPGAPVCMTCSAAGLPSSLAKSLFLSPHSS